MEPIVKIELTATEARNVVKALRYAVTQSEMPEFQVEIDQLAEDINEQLVAQGAN